MTEIVPRERGTKANMYPPHVVDTALTVLAVVNGNAHETSRRLEAQGVFKPDGTPIAVSTIRTWAKSTYADRYLEIREQVLPRIKMEMAEKMEGAALHGISIQEQIMSRLEQEIPNLAPKDLGKNLQHVGIATGINSQRSAELRGDPNFRPERTDIDEIKRGLERLGVIESTAEEIPA